jgi:hypothetical protein
MPQTAIRGDQGDLIRGICSDVNEQVVSTAGGMEDRHPVGYPGLDATSSLPFQDHDNRGGEPARSHRGSHLIHECPGGSGSVPPPAGRAGSDDICSINEQHSPSLIAPRP